MATKLTKPVRREVEVPGHGNGTMIVTIDRDGVSFRPKGKRFTLLLPYPRAVQTAAEIKAAQLIAERKAKRARRAR